MSEISTNDTKTVSSQLVNSSNEGTGNPVVATDAIATSMTASSGSFGSVTYVWTPLSTYLFSMKEETSSLNNNISTVSNSLNNLSTNFDTLSSKVDTLQPMLTFSETNGSDVSADSFTVITGMSESNNVISFTKQKITIPKSDTEGNIVEISGVNNEPNKTVDISSTDNESVASYIDVSGTTVTLNHTNINVNSLKTTVNTLNNVITDIEGSYYGFTSGEKGATIMLGETSGGYVQSFDTVSHVSEKSEGLYKGVSYIVNNISFDHIIDRMTYHTNSIVGLYDTQESLSEEIQTINTKLNDIDNSQLQLTVTKVPIGNTEVGETSSGYTETFNYVSALDYNDGIITVKTSECSFVNLNNQIENAANKANKVTELQQQVETLQNTVDFQDTTISNLNTTITNLQNRLNVLDPIAVTINALQLLISYPKDINDNRQYSVPLYLRNGSDNTVVSESTLIVGNVGKSFTNINGNRSYIGIPTCISVGTIENPAPTFKEFQVTTDDGSVAFTSSNSKLFFDEITGTNVTVTCVFDTEEDTTLENLTITSAQRCRFVISVDSNGIQDGLSDRIISTGGSITIDKVIREYGSISNICALNTNDTVNSNVTLSGFEINGKLGELDNGIIHLQNIVDGATIELLWSTVATTTPAP